MSISAAQEMDWEKLGDMQCPLSRCHYYVCAGASCIAKQFTTSAQKRLVDDRHIGTTLSPIDFCSIGADDTRI
jgi:hypothetical protein